MMLAEQEPSALPALWEGEWWQRWQHRPHFFDGCLDLHLAVTALNIGRYQGKSALLSVPWMEACAVHACAVHATPV